jgi:hypothetical protein
MAIQMQFKKYKKTALWECKKIKSLWLQLAEWLRKTIKKTIEFNMENVILGKNLLAHIKLITKEYIYKHKLEEETPNLKGLISYIKHRCQIEKHYTPAENFVEKWGEVLLKKILG